MPQPPRLNPTPLALHQQKVGRIVRLGRYTRVAGVHDWRKRGRPPVQVPAVVVADYGEAPYVRVFGRMPRKLVVTTRNNGMTVKVRRRLRDWLPRWRLPWTA